MRKLVLKMSMSLDGFVGGPNGESDWIFRTADDASNAWEMELIGRVGLHGMPIFGKCARPLDLELVYAKPFPGGTVAQLYRPKR